ncbi:MAG: CBS domain-containing protein [Coprobacillus sp.]|nr:CBS domain-containing protein [Coprobacillus sp.]
MPKEPQINLLSLLLPKKDVCYITNTESVKEVMAKMEEKKYSMIPVLNEEGIYLYSISEGDILYYLKDNFFDMKNIEDKPISIVPPRRQIKSVAMETTERDSLELISTQNYVPVVDDRKMFIGIITRSALVSKFRELGLGIFPEDK